VYFNPMAQPTSNSPATTRMTQAICDSSTLPADEQDRIAGWLQSELVSEEGWTRRFAHSQELLNTLAA
jgi:hypothetical protein